MVGVSEFNPERKVFDGGMREFLVNGNRGDGKNQLLIGEDCGEQIADLAKISLSGDSEGKIAENGGEFALGRQRANWRV